VQPWPEVVRTDEIAAKRFDEPFGPFPHVHGLESLELGGDFPSRPVKLTVQVVHRGSAAAPIASALALRAAKLDLPGTTAEIDGPDGVNETRVTRIAPPRMGVTRRGSSVGLPSAWHGADDLRRGLRSHRRQPQPRSPVFPQGPGRALGAREDLWEAAAREDTAAARDLVRRFQGQGLPAGLAVDWLVTAE
jgi:hypothetical protein